MSTDGECMPAAGGKWTEDELKKMAEEGATQLVRDLAKGILLQSDYIQLLDSDLRDRAAEIEKLKEELRDANTECADLSDKLADHQ